MMTKLLSLQSLLLILHSSFVLAHNPDITPSARPIGNQVKQIHGDTRRLTQPQPTKNNRFRAPLPPARPIINSFSPANGAVGTTVTLSGANFNAAKTSNIVFFGATRATVTEATESSLTVTVPEGATYQPISILNSDTKLTGYSASPFIITFNPNNTSITKADFFSQLDLSPASSSTAQFMTTGDLDGDGKVDMVSVNSDAGTNNLSIFRNISSGGTLTAASFAAKIQLSLNGAPAGIAIADLNGDGKPELIALDASGVSIFLNTSTSDGISFAPKVDLSITNGVGVSVGDLDNDGNTDIIVSDRKDGTVFVFRNTSTNGNLSFANAISAATFTTGGPESVAIGDLDGDGKVDMTVPNKVSGLVSIFPNNSTPGNIAFGTAIVLTAGTKPVKAAIGDFNTDGKPDLVIANSTSSNVSVFQNTSTVGNISFAAKSDLPGDTKITSVAVTDIDGDGKVDIVSVAVNGGGTVSVFRNVYTSGAIAVSSFASKSLLNSLLNDVTIGDIDGDGRPDLVGTNQKVITVLRYNPFKTKVSDAFSGKTLANIDSAIRADVVTSSSTYRFRVTQGVNVQTIDVQTNFFKLTQLTSYAYNTSYSIDVQVQAGGIWSDYGAIGVVTTPAPLTQLSEAFQGKTLISIDSAVRADFVPLATSYRFRVTQGVNVQTIDVQTNSFKFTQLTNYANASSYSIDVQVQVGGNWSSYGAAYVVNTPVPLTQVSDSFHGKTLTSIDNTITADVVPSATIYRFRVTQGVNIQTLDVQTNSFKLTQLANYAYNTSYNIDVQVQLNGSWANYGTAYVITTPTVPVTQISASLRGKTLTSADNAITADIVPLATAYRFRITKDTAIQTIDAQTNSFNLSQLTNYDYNTSFSIDVEVQAGGNWSGYGTAYAIITPPVPLTQISESLRGNTLASIDSSIPADAAPSATTYRFRVTQRANVQTIDVQTNSFKLTQLAHYAYNTSYSIDVQIQVGENWSDYGTAYVITTPMPITQVITSLRGSTLASIDSAIIADPLPLATGYRFRVTQNAMVQTIDVQANSFKFTQLTNYAYNTGYSIDVQTQVGENWGNYGTAYTVTTPAPLTQISESLRGKTLLNVDSVITADPLPLATGYRFRVTKGSAVQTLDAPTNSFKMKDVNNYAYNARYSMDVAVKTGATVNAFGPVSFINTPVTPVTQVTASYCGTQLTDLDGAVRADALPLATVYRFRIKQGSNEQVIEETVPQTLLYKTTFYAYNTTYTVDVSANVAGTWTAYGAACDVTTLRAPITQVSLINCGKVLTSNDGQVYADHVPTATAYRFRMTVNGQTDSLDEPTSFARLGAMPSYEFNTTYSVRVAALVNGVWTPYGAACNVTTPVLVPQISTEMCGTVLTTVDGEIHEDLIPATQFRFKVTDGVHTDTLQSSIGSIRLSSLSFYAYNTVYTVQVAVLRNGVWTSYGPACNVTTTNAVLATKLGSAYCGKVLTSNDGQIYADGLPLATTYRFRIMLNGHTDSLDASTPFVRLAAMPSYEFNTTYSIRVSALVNGVWTVYGSACDVTTPVLVPQLSTEICGTVLSTVYGEVHEDLIPATQFRFKITDGVHTDTLQSQIGSIRLSSLSFYAYNTVFTVQVAVLRNGVWTPYGPACNVTTTNAVLATKVGSAYCGKVLTTNDGEIYADDLPLATAYRFQITLNGQTDSLDASTSFVRLAAMPSYQFNTTYSIRVSALINGVWTAYGAACDVTTPAPVTQLSAGYCGTVLPAWNAQVQADLVDFANGYQFRVTQGSNVQIILSATNKLLLSDVTFFAFNTPFSIEVAAKEGNALAAYGAVCMVTTPAALTNANLSALSLSKGKVKLNPVFDQETLSYTALVSNATTAIKLKPTVADGTATVKINGTPVTSGSDSENISLLVGANTITTVVTAQDGTTTKSYQTVITRDKAVPVITFNSLPAKTYGDKDFDPDAMSNNMGIPVTYSSSDTTVATIVSGQLHIIGAGSATITASQDTDATHYAAINVTRLLTVGRAALTITADDKNGTYGSTLPDLTVSYSGFVNGDESLATAATATTQATTGSPAHTYPIVPGGAADNNYTISYTNGTLTIGQRAITVTATATAKNYGDTDPAFAYTTDVPLIGEDIFTGDLTRDAGEDVNDYAIKQGTLALNANYNLTYTGANFTIGQRAITVTALAAAKNYGDSDPVLTYQVTTGSLAGTDAFTGALTRDAGESVNDYAIKQGTLTLNGNYNLSYMGGANLIIGKKAITVTTDAQTKTYGDGDPLFTYHFSPALISGDNFNGNLTRDPGENTGNYTINQGTLLLSNNYNLNYTAASLTISRKIITVTADAQSKTYGNDDAALTYDFSPALITGDHFSGALSRATGERAGTYAIGQGTLALGLNYILNYIAADLTIKNKTLTITAANQSKIYGQENPALTVSYSGFVNGDGPGVITTQPMISTTADRNSNAGVYTITATAAVAADYTLVYIPGVLTINKAPLAITADNNSRNYGASNPSLTLNYNGFVNGDTPNSFISPAVATTTATTNSPPGNYVIISGGGVSDNYTLTYRNGTLTVIPLGNADISSLTLSSGTLSPAYSSSTFAYTVGVTYDTDHLLLTPTYDVTATATINGAPVTNGSPAYQVLLNTGNNTITATVLAQDGVTKNTYTITVYRALPIVAIKPSNILSPNGDGKNDTWVIKDIQLYPNNTVTVYDQTGRVIYTKRDYNNEWDGTFRGTPLAQGTYYYIIDFGVTTTPIVRGFITILKSH